MMNLIKKEHHIIMLVLVLYTSAGALKITLHSINDSFSISNQTKIKKLYNNTECVDMYVE